MTTRLTSCKHVEAMRGMSLRDERHSDVVSFLAVEHADVLFDELEKVDG